MTDPKREKDWAEREAEKCLPAHQYLQGAVASTLRVAKDIWLEQAAKVCDESAAAHRDSEETTWTALAESDAERIRALKGKGGP
jgi:hypothetical protein